MNAPLKVARDDEIAFSSGPSTLIGRLFRPASKPKAIVLIHGATAVPQGFYRAFAEWLTTQGLAAFTYDYRDFGRSATVHPRRSKTTILDWTLSDQVAAQAEAERQVPNTPLWVIGHSLGGLFLPWHKDAANIARVITIASGLVHHSDHPRPYRASALAFWYGPGALSTVVLGYTPGKLLGLGANFPKGVYWQWRQFCTIRNFHQREAGKRLPMPDWAAVKGPMKVIAVGDDPMVPPQAVWRLMQIYPEAHKRQLTLTAPDNRKIGHMGAFRRENADLWPQIIA